MSFRNVFNIKDKVFVKRRGYPVWPAIIYSVNNNIQQTTYNVFLYGSGDCIECKAEQLLLYEENKSKIKLNKKNSKYKLLVKAFYEVQDTPPSALLSSENDTQVFSTPSSTKQVFHLAKTLDGSKDVDRIQLIDKNPDQYHSENERKSKTNVSSEFTDNEDLISRNNVNFTASIKTKRKISDNQIKKSKKKINKSLATKIYKLDETQHNLNEENKYDLSKPQSILIEPAKAPTLTQIKNNYCTSEIFSQGLCNIEQGSDTDQFVDIHKINKANNCISVNDGMLEVNKSSLLKKNNQISTPKKRKKKESSVKPKKQSKKSTSIMSQDVELLKKNKSSIESNEISARFIENGSIIFEKKFKLNEILPIVLVTKLSDELLTLVTNKNKNIKVDQEVLKTYDKHVKTANTTKSTIESSDTIYTRNKGLKSTHKLNDYNTLSDKKASTSYIRPESCSSPSLKTRNYVNPKKSRLSRLNKRLSKATKDHNVCKIETEDILDQNYKPKGSSSNSKIENSLNCSDVSSIHINNSVAKESHQFRIKRNDKHVKSNNETESTVEYSDTLWDSNKSLKFTSKLNDCNTLSDPKASTSHVNDVSCSSPSLKTTNVVNPKKSRLSRLNTRLSKATKEHNVCKIETDDILEQNCTTKGSSSNSKMENTLNCSYVPSIHSNDIVSKKTHEFRIKRNDKHAKSNNETESTVEYSDTLLDSSKSLKFTSKLTDSNTLSDQKASTSRVNDISFTSPSLKTRNLVNPKKPGLSRLNKLLSKTTNDHNVFKIETDDILEQNCKTKGTNLNSKTENTLKCTDIPSIHINNCVSKDTHQFGMERSDKHAKSNKMESTVESNDTLLDCSKSLKLTSKLNDCNTLSDPKASTSHINDVSYSSPNPKKLRLSRPNKRFSKAIKKHDASEIETDNFFESNGSNSNSKTENTQECTHTPSVHRNNGASKETQQFSIKRSDKYAKSNNEIESSDTLLNNSKSLKFIIKLNNCNSLSDEKTSNSRVKYDSCLSPNLKTTNIVNPKNSRFQRLNKRLSKAIKKHDASKNETDGILEQNCNTKGSNSNSKIKNTLNCSDIPSIHKNDSVAKESHQFRIKRSDKHDKSNNKTESIVESSVTLLDSRKSLKFTSKLNDPNTLSDQKASTSHVNEVSCSSPTLKTTNVVNPKKLRLSRLNKQLSKAIKKNDTRKIETYDIFEPNCKNSNSETKDTLKSTLSPSLYLNNHVSEEKHKLSNKINNLPSPLKDILTDFVATLEINSEEQQSEFQKIAQINLLQIEVDTLDCIYKLQSALSINHFDYEMALQLLEKISKLEIHASMLMKHRVIYDTIKKVTLYVGNASEWKLNKQKAIEHAEKAAKIRYKAQILYHKFVLLFTNGNLEKFKEIYDKNL